MTKKGFSLALLSMFMVVMSFAANKNLDKDITMVSYEQSWRDSHGTLALKNNTSEKIQNVVFLVTYLDMSGKELDYEEFFRKVDIAPGMTRKVDISAYEQGRQYHYYKSEGLYDNTSFKIKFKLKDYNVEEDEDDNANEGTVESIDDNPFSTYDYNRSRGNDGIDVIVGILALLLLMGLTVGLYVLVAVMAMKRNRSAVVWILLSILATPLLMVIILLVIGKNENYIENNYDRE